MEISGLICIADKANLLSNPTRKTNMNCEPMSCKNGSYSRNGSWNGNCTLLSISADDEKETITPSSGKDPLSKEANDHPLSTELPEVFHRKKIVRTGSQTVFELDSIPVWGFASLCGRRPEMEDAVAIVPGLLQIPTQMLMDDRVLDGLNQDLGHLTAHFFGVYDGHGGSQVANYCSKRMHSALAKEIEHAKASLSNGTGEDSWQDQWKKTFSNCFLKVDAEIGGSCRDATPSNISGGSKASFEPIPYETVGSTAVVAVVCPTHIIVANCGDSRAVLHRGKIAMPLSADHKPDRDDEYARIEAAGGKVIEWNGSRVCGVLAMSRSIGDRYLKPWVIPDPEVMLIPRTEEDECLILASDGLWDIMSNEAACYMARKRILSWYRKNGNSPSTERGGGVNPAAQAAAEYLSRHAFRLGSNDNITVVVVDLKAQRKFIRNTQ